MLLLHRRRRRHREFLHHIQKGLLLPPAAAPATPAPSAAGRLRRVARILGGDWSFYAIKDFFEKVWPNVSEHSAKYYQFYNAEYRFATNNV